MVPNDVREGYQENVCTRCMTKNFKFDNLFNVIQEQSMNSEQETNSSENEDPKNVTSELKENQFILKKEKLLSITFGISEIKRTGVMKIKLSHRIDIRKAKKYKTPRPQME